MLNLDRLKKIGVAQKETIPDAMHRIILARDRIDEAISAFESACAAEGMKYQVKQEEKETSFDLMISLARYHDLMIFGLRSVFEYSVSFEEPKDTLVRLISAGVRPIIAVSLPLVHLLRHIVLPEFLTTPLFCLWRHHPLPYIYPPIVVIPLFSLANLTTSRMACTL